MRHTVQIYDRRKAAGQCPECGGPRVVGIYCDACRAYHRFRMKVTDRPRRRHRRKADGRLKATRG